MAFKDVETGKAYHRSYSIAWNAAKKAADPVRFAHQHAMESRIYRKRQAETNTEEWSSRNAARQRMRRDRARAVTDALKLAPCADCGLIFPPEAMDFDHVRGLKSGGVTNIYSVAGLLAEVDKCELVCACCHRFRTWTRNQIKGVKPKTGKLKRQTDMLDELKQAPCTDCGLSFPPCAMDFDHVRGEKLFNVSHMRGGKTDQQILDEVAKCELVCACCHRIRTRDRQSVTQVT